MVVYIYQQYIDRYIIYIIISYIYYVQINMVNSINKNAFLQSIYDLSMCMQTKYATQNTFGYYISNYHLIIYLLTI